MMKKMMRTNAFFALVFCCLNISAAVQTDPPVPTLGPIVSSTVNPNEYYYTPNSCLFTLPFKVLLTNLGTLNDNSNNIQQLPQGYPNMYLAYTINGAPKVYTPLTSFTYVGLAEGIPIYEAVVEYGPINIFDFCDVDGANQGYPLQYGSSLVTDGNSNNYIPYPYGDYLGACDIFSCLLDPSLYCEDTEGFPEGQSAAPRCHLGQYNGNQGNNTAVGSLTDFVEASPIGTIFLGCNNCTGQQTGGQTYDYVQNGLSSEIFDFNLSPNPFTNNFEVNWSKLDSPQEMSLFDTTGKLLKHWDQTTLQGRSSLFVKTTDLAQGIYFMQINSDRGTQSRKIIKQ